jgi:hypothetical protein
MGAALGSIIPTIIIAHMASIMTKCAAVHDLGHIASIAPRAIPGMSGIPDVSAISCMLPAARTR